LIYFSKLSIIYFCHRARLWSELGSGWGVQSLDMVSCM
jgi:hypothetical protein